METIHGALYCESYTRTHKCLGNGLSQHLQVKKYLHLNLGQAWTSLSGTQKLTPWNRFLPEKLVKKLPAFYKTKRLITAFTITHHLSLSWARSIQSAPPSHFLKIHFNIILPSMFGSCKWLHSSGFPTKTLYTPRLAPSVLHVLPISVFLTW